MEQVSPQDIKIGVNKAAHRLVMLEHGNEARKCDTSMNLISDYNAASKCDGGQFTTCLSLVPFVLDCFSEVGYAFGVVPGAGPNAYGRCF